MNISKIFTYTKGSIPKKDIFGRAEDCIDENLGWQFSCFLLRKMIIAEVFFLSDFRKQENTQRILLTGKAWGKESEELSSGVASLGSYQKFY